MTSAKSKRRLAIFAGVIVAYVAGDDHSPPDRGTRSVRNAVVRCRRGHLFTTVWIPGASVKASCGSDSGRIQWCPVGRHVDLVRPVKDADLTEAERSFAMSHHDRAGSLARRLGGRGGRQMTGTPQARKLGLKGGMRVALDTPPGGWELARPARRSAPG